MRANTNPLSDIKCNQKNTQSNKRVEAEECRNSNKVRKQQEQEVKMTTKGPKQLDYLSILSQLRRGRSDWPLHWCLLTGSD